MTLEFVGLREFWDALLTQASLWLMLAPAFFYMSLKLIYSTIHDNQSTIASEVSDDLKIATPYMYYSIHFFSLIVSIFLYCSNLGSALIENNIIQPHKTITSIWMTVVIIVAIILLSSGYFSNVKLFYSYKIFGNRSAMPEMNRLNICRIIFLVIYSSTFILGLCYKELRFLL